MGRGVENPRFSFFIRQIRHMLGKRQERPGQVLAEIPDDCEGCDSDEHHSGQQNLRGPDERGIGLGLGKIRGQQPIFHPQPLEGGEHGHPRAAHIFLRALKSLKRPVIEGVSPFGNFFEDPVLIRMHDHGSVRGEQIEVAVFSDLFLRELTQDIGAHQVKAAGQNGDDLALPVKNRRGHHDHRVFVGLGRDVRVGDNRGGGGQGIFDVGAER
ncbi:MAG: hypothetical protein ACD_74C00247G0003 [uncultured bacterium]|nr:MAG: hypothetical protein ACD_74C00247G0003 [uncultured bacterium]